jgi:hypothetical protein
MDTETEPRWLASIPKGWRTAIQKEVGHAAIGCIVHGFFDKAFAQDGWGKGISEK